MQFVLIVSISIKEADYVLVHFKFNLLAHHLSLF